MTNTPDRGQSGSGRSPLTEAVADSQPFWGIVALLVVFYAGDRLLFNITRLPADAYESSFIFGELVTSVLISTPSGVATTALIAALLSLALWKRTLGPRWDEIADGGQIRVLVGVVVFVLTWAFATYAYNFYFDQLHLADRLLLIVLVPSVLWRPSFIVGYLIVLLPIVWQFDVPIGGFSVAEPILLIRVLLLVLTAYALNVIFPVLRSGDIVFVVCCLIAAHYWVSGVGKLAIGWLHVDHIPYLLPATYANGWWGFVSPDTIGTWTSRLESLNTLIKIATITIECGALVILWRRTTVRILLVGFIALHIGIFLVSGILFWKWIVLDATVLALFFSTRSPNAPIHSLPYFVLSIILIGGGSIWFRPLELVWLDVPVSYTYRVEAGMEDGRSYPLPPAYFSPYDYQFTLGAFSYLSEEPLLGIVWGATRDRAVMDSLIRSPGRAKVESLERTRGILRSNPDRRDKFERFVARFVGNRQTKPGVASRLLGQGRVPAQLWTYPRRSRLPAGERPARIYVYRVTSLFDGVAYVEIDSARVTDIAMSPP